MWNYFEGNFTVNLNWTVPSSVSIQLVNSYNVVLRQYDSDGGYISGSKLTFDILSEVSYLCMVLFRADLTPLFFLSQQNTSSYSIVHSNVSPKEYLASGRYTVSRLVTKHALHDSKAH